MELMRCFPRHCSKWVFHISVLWIRALELTVVVPVVGDSTRYGLTVRESNPGGGRDFPHPFRQAPGHISLQYDGYRVFLGDKTAGAWR